VRKLRQGKYDEALESLKKAQAMVPDVLEVTYNIAVTRCQAILVGRK
jgi:hypothetical protein